MCVPELMQHVSPTITPGSENLTVVTAYFDISSFSKTGPSAMRSVGIYLKWANIYRDLQNPLVADTDSKIFKDHMLSVRRQFTEKTKIFLIQRNSSWAFKQLDTIKHIYDVKGYPKYPNAIPAEYSCAQNAKYDAVSRAARANYFSTDYFTWLDVGLFRNEVDNPRKFALQIPANFNSSRIGVTHVYNVSMDKNISRIFRENLVWLCGCIFMGRREVILKYTQQYKQAVDYALSLNMMNTDQQVIYAIYSVQGRKKLKPEVDLHLYQTRTKLCEAWNYLGYAMRKWT